MLKCLDFTFDITTFIYLHLKKCDQRKSPPSCLQQSADLSNHPESLPAAQTHDHIHAEAILRKTRLLAPSQSSHAAEKWLRR